jgi:hypothetical protein
MWIACGQLRAYQYPEELLSVAKLALKLAQKYELTEFTYHFSRLIISYYSFHMPSLKKFNYYNEIKEKSRRTLMAEELAEYAYFSLYLLLSESQRSRTKAELFPISNPLRLKLRRYNDIQSTKFLRFNYLYNITCAEITCDHYTAIRLCKEAIIKLNSKPFTPLGPIFSLQLRHISNLIKVHRIGQARSIYQSYILTTDTGSHSWFTLNLYAFILESHERNYNKASEIIEQSVQLKQFQTLSQPLRQLWLICSAFNAFFIETGRVTAPKSKHKPFRIYKFLNDVPMYSKDKRGMNITILIIHVLFLMWQKKYARADERIDALKAYSNRYLRDDANFRSNCFIKMLVQLAKGDFHPIRGQRYAQKFVERLKEVPLSKSRQGLEIEIVPYEHLWEMIVKMCPSS